MVTLTELVTERAKLIARVEKIDGLLKAKHGIEMAAKVRRSRPQRAAVIAALKSGAVEPKSIAAATGQGVHAAQQMLHLMVKEGIIRRVSFGKYEVSPAREKGSVAA